MQNAIRIAFLSTFLLLSCEDNGTNVENRLAQMTAQDTVREVVFRYQFDHNHSGQQRTAKVYFLSVMVPEESTGYWTDHDPSRELLHCFDGNTPPVKAFYKCRRSEEGVFDLETNEMGLLFQTGAIRWITNDQAEVDGGYFEGGLSASGDTYYLERKDGQWIVTRDVMHWIS
jgi:hypothetical protein